MTGPPKDQALGDCAYFRSPYLTLNPAAGVGRYSEGLEGIRDWKSHHFDNPGHARDKHKTSCRGRYGATGHPVGRFNPGQVRCQGIHHWKCALPDLSRAGTQGLGEMIYALQPCALCFDFDYPLACELTLLCETKRRHPALPIVMLTEPHSEALAVWVDCARLTGECKPIS